MSSKDQAAPKAMPIATPSRVISALEPSDTQSANLLEGNLAQLKTLFPEAFKEGGIDFEVLKQLLGAQVDEREEKYGLNWHGKRRARQIALTPSTGTLRPCPGESVDWDTTQNLMIEGDNLEVLKLLQKSYAGKVKMIYIDPPYNTGKDFVYPDNFTDNIKNYLELTGQTDGEGRKLSSNTEASGRFHTDWLNMMYPRLKLAYNLLKPEGAIFVSCDEGEQARLRISLDDLFGQENFVADMVWAAGRKNDSRLVSVSHEYIVCYAKNKAYLTEQKIEWRQRKKGLEEIYSLYEKLKRELKTTNAEKTIALKQWYKNLPDSHPSKSHKHYCQIDDRGIYFAADISWPGGGGPQYEVLHPTTKKKVKNPARGWITPDVEKMRAWISDSRVHFGEDEASVPCLKAYLRDQEYQAPYSVFYQDGRSATKRLRELMGDDCFNFPKDEGVIQELIGMMSSGNDLVVDFFAGSGTTGHALFAQNSIDHMERRFILVQLPESLDAENNEQSVAASYCDTIAKARNIAELTKERLRRAATRIGASRAHKDSTTAQLSLENEAETPQKPLDLGFKVFKLDTSNIRAWNPNPDELADTLMAHTEHLATGRTEADVLYEVLLKQGLDLAVPVQRQVIAGHTVHSVGAGALLVCLAAAVNARPRDYESFAQESVKAMDQSSVTAANAEALALGIADWHTQLATALGQTPQELHTRVVLRDSLFDGDVAKTNLTAILRQRGLEDVRSL